MKPGLGESADPAIGFPPIASANAHTLILGSLPGVRSIQAAQYYAHPRNAFWRIMAELVGAEGNYRQRCKILRDRHIAVWDVLRSSVRPGSLDVNIDTKTAQVNDFVDFFLKHRKIERLCFNGQKAAQIFSARIVSAGIASQFQLHTLPSTSPAHASMSYEQKLKLWRDGLAIRSVESRR